MSETNSANFLYSCVEEKKRNNEQFVADHALGIILSGESHFHTEEGFKIYTEGTIGLVKRNQLVKTAKVPPAQGEFQSINLIFGQDFLHRYAAEHNLQPTRYQGDSMIELKENSFLKGYFASLLPYFTTPARMTAAMAELKTREAIELLLQAAPRGAEMLFDFREPFKIDLEAYMNKNYMYNASIPQFARLTGRSLATFKRDFQKTFDDSPERWIRKRRLELAHFLIAHKKQKPTDTYLEVGFENLSHFSTAFRKFYGYTPSSLHEVR